MKLGRDEILMVSYEICSIKAKFSRVDQGYTLLCYREIYPLAQFLKLEGFSDKLNA